MQCDKLENRVHQLLDQRKALVFDDEWAVHLQQCPHCSELVALYEAMLDGLESGEVPAPSADFAATVIAASAPPVRATGWREAVLRGAAALAAIAGMLLVGFFAIRSGGHNAEIAHDSPTAPAIIGAADVRPAEDLAADVDSPAPAPQGDAVDSPAGQIAVDDRSPNSQQAEDRKADLQDIEERQIDYAQTWESLRPLLPEIPEQSPSAVDQIAGGFRPIAVSVSATLNVLRKTLPGGKDQREEKPPAGAFVPATSPSVG